MKSKEQLKQEFKNLQKPDENDFSELIESYFHKDVPITLDELTQLKANLATIDKTNDGVETLGNVDTKEQVNAKINFAINALKANAPETYDTLKEIADYIAGDANAEAALIQLINTKLDKPILTNGKIPKSNGSTLIDSAIFEDSGKVGIGITPNSTFNSAQLNFKTTDRKIMNIPKTNFLSSFSNNQPSQNQQLGDVYNNGDNIYWLRSNSNTERWKKLTGFDVDYICKLPQDFNSLKTTYSDTIVNSNFDTLDKYGFANIWTSDYCYGQKLTERFTNITNADSRMYEGVLTNINLGLFNYNGAVQQYQDIKGNLFLRGLGYAYTEQDWKKVVSEKTNTTTTLSEKIDATKGVNTKDLSFTLQSSITPTPNTLVPKIDGSGLMWYNNSSVGNEFMLLPPNWKFGYGSGNILSNTAIGVGVLNSNTTGLNNTAIGAQPMYFNTTGSDNIAIGNQTLYWNLIGSRNVALGNNAARSVGSDNNTAIGHAALRGGSGGNNTAIGYSAMYTNTTGAYNASLGTNSLQNNTTGSANVALGHNSLYQNTTGSENIGVGDAMHGNTTGSYNISLGSGSLYFHTAPSKIIALGRYTLRSITSGTDNIAIGYYAGQWYGGVTNFLTSATNCILLGTNSAPLNDNSQNEIVIGHNAIGSGDNTATIGNSSTDTLHLLKNGAGIVLKSPDGTKKIKISIDNSGNLITTLI